MYNSSIKGKNKPFEASEFKEIPGKVFKHDMTLKAIPDAFYTCDCIYSEPAWQYGYPIFNERAGFVASDGWSAYAKNINRVVKEVGAPAYIIGGKIHQKYFKDADIAHEITIKHDGKTISAALVYLFNGALMDSSIKTTEQLTDYLSSKYDRVLDFSCGYGEHLLKFKDFIGTDIDKNCLAYLSEKVRERQ